MKRILPLLVMLLAFTVSRPAQSRPLPKMALPSVPVSGAIQAAVRQALVSWDRGHYYGISDVLQDGDYWFVSVIASTKPAWSLTDTVVDLSHALVWQDERGIYHSAIRGSQEYSEVLPLTSIGRAQPEIDPLMLQQTTQESYIFPWEKNKYMFYGPAEIHGGGFGLTGWQAVDFVSGDDLGDDAAPNDMYGAANAIINYTCRDGVSLAVRAGDLLYAHLNDEGQNIGDEIERGVKFGDLKYGTFTGGVSPNCGWASQQEDHYHVHLVFPDPSENGGYFYMERWKLSAATEVWTSGNETVEAGDWLQAEWDTSIDPRFEGDANFWDAVLDGGEVVAELVADALPGHESLELAFKVAQYAALPVRILYTTALLKFGLAFVFITIIVLMEIIRMIYIAWMWIKRAIPFVG